MFCRLTINRFVRLWLLFHRGGKEPRREQKLVFDLGASLGLDRAFFSNHVDLEAVIPGGL